MPVWVIVTGSATTVWTIVNVDVIAGRVSVNRISEGILLE